MQIHVASKFKQFQRKWSEIVCCHGFHNYCYTEKPQTGILKIQKKYVVHKYQPNTLKQSACLSRAVSPWARHQYQ